jgi:tRNA nucleotidyltransferase (CCA-adding enzyme)
MTDRGWEHFRHEADIGVRGWGPTLAEAYAQGALALTAVVARLDDVVPRVPVAITCEAPDPELLFADWLNAIVYEMATLGYLFSRFEVTTDGNHLAATAWGEPVERDRHEPAVEVKGATYTALRVSEEPGGRWVAQTVVDV